MDKMFWGAILLPVLIGVFKSELLELYADYRIWKNRAVKEGDLVELLNPNTGSWTEVEVIDYTFGLMVTDRVVWFKHVGSGRVEAVPFKVWSGFRKYVK